MEDRGRILEKISTIQSALGSTKTDSAAQEPASPPATEQPQTTANPLSEDQIYDRPLQALREMRAQVEERVRPLAKMVVDSEVTRLREQAEQQQAKLNSCLTAIDRALISCVEQLAEYRDKHASLITLNDRIAHLGGAPEALPDSFSQENFIRTIQERLAALRDQGKL
jgi:phage shock protein A